ncbi:MAG: hypothetical protein PHE56_11085, partial [Bacteroidales bacterium]|nr:hypothetical protein [Bacteroidales bacterium]
MKIAIKFILLSLSAMICMDAYSQSEYDESYDRTYYVRTRYLSNHEEAGDLVPVNPQTLDIYTGPLDKCIESALLYLDGLAEDGVGENAIIRILFEVEPDNLLDPYSCLVIFDEELPAINHTIGTIIFESAIPPESFYKQGFTQTVLDCSPYSVFVLDKCNNVDIRFLTFYNINVAPSLISINTANNVNMYKNNFINDIPSTFNGSNILSIHKTFEETSSLDNNIEFQFNEGLNQKGLASIDVYPDANINISNNIYHSNIYTSPQNFRQIFASNDPGLESYNGNLTINRNEIYFMNDVISFVNPKSTWQFCDNTIHFGRIALEIVIFDSDCKFDLINETNLPYNSNNSGNVFILDNTTPLSGLRPTIQYYCDECNNVEPFNVIGYDLPIQIRNYHLPNLLIRKNKIKATPIDKKPISNMFEGVYDIKPNLSSIIRFFNIANNPTVLSYTLDLDANNGDFAVDVYSSNLNGDLIEDKSSLQISSTNQNINNPDYLYSNYFFNPSNIRHFALTTTSIGKSSQSFHNGLGTSNAAYFVLNYDITCPEHMCINDPISFEIDGQTGFSFSFDEGDFNPYISSTITETFETSGVHVLKIKHPDDDTYPYEEWFVFNIFDDDICNPPSNNVTTDDCIGRFSPASGEKYVVSAWVKDSPLAGEYPGTYFCPTIVLNYYYENPD